VIVVIDNYDSFTYNVVQLLATLGADVEVVRNDHVGIKQLDAMNPAALVISPGPGGPEDAGISCEAIGHFAGAIPVFGICLGLQCIGHVFGGRVVRAGELVHGKTTPILHGGEGVFAGIPNGFAATRYHSLVVEAASVPECFDVTATTESGLIMGLRHRTLDVEGVQFHPESIASTYGDVLLANFLARTASQREVA
jgi:anthranilate synthase/aminodeoxychorismate synthase-like glutamine amidotransferase